MPPILLDERLSAPWDSEDRLLFGPVSRFRRFAWLAMLFRWRRR